MKSVLVLLACALVGVAAPASAHLDVGGDGDGSWGCSPDEYVTAPVPHPEPLNPGLFHQCYVLA